MSFLDIDTSDSTEYFESPERFEAPSLLYTGPEMLDSLAHTSRGEPDTFGSTPFNPHLASIADQQRYVALRHEDLFLRAPHTIRKELIPEAIDFNYGRVHHRQHRNFESFECREHYSFDCVPEELQETAQRSITGHGSPAENLIIADILGMPAVELGSVTLGGGDPKRMEDQVHMRKAISECIQLFDGVEVRSHRDPRHTSWSRLDDFKLKRIDDDINAFRMTRTRLIGRVDNYLIHERSSFLLDITKLDPSLVEQIKEVPTDDPNRKQNILDIPKFHFAVREALRDDRFDVAVPIATTCWAVHGERNAQFMNDEWRKYHMQRIREDISKPRAQLDANYALLGLD